MDGVLSRRWRSLARGPGDDRGTQVRVWRLRGPGEGWFIENGKSPTYKWDDDGDGSPRETSIKHDQPLISDKTSGWLDVFEKNAGHVLQTISLESKWNKHVPKKMRDELSTQLGSDNLAPGCFGTMILHPWCIYAVSIRKYRSNAPSIRISRKFAWTTISRLGTRSRQVPCSVQFRGVQNKCKRYVLLWGIVVSACSCLTSICFNASRWTRKTS